MIKYKCFFVDIGSADGQYTVLVVPSVCCPVKSIVQVCSQSDIYWISPFVNPRNIWQLDFNPGLTMPPRPPGSPLWPEMLNILLECSEVTVWPGVTCVLSGVNIIWYLQGDAVMVSMDDSDASTREGRTMHDKMFLHKWEPFQTLSPLTLITRTIMVRNN